MGFTLRNIKTNQTSLLGESPQSKVFLKTDSVQKNTGHSKTSDKPNQGPKEKNSNVVEPEVTLPKGYTEFSPYSSGKKILTDKGKIEYWKILERQRETKHDLMQIMEAQDIMAKVLQKADSNVFLLTVVMNSLDSLQKSFRFANRELMELDEEIILYNYYLRKPVLLKQP